MVLLFFFYLFAHHRHFTSEGCRKQGFAMLCQQFFLVSAIVD
jgi:hypothetical protein